MQKRIAIVIVALVVLGGAVYFLTKKDSDTPVTNNSTNTSQPAQEEVSLEDALSEIGATGNAGPVNGNTYTFNGVEYRFEVPNNWNTSMNQRKQACEQGFINTSYQVVTDGSTWFATTDNNSDYGVLVEALKGAGISAEVSSYC